MIEDLLEVCILGNADPDFENLAALVNYAFTLLKAASEGKTSKREKRNFGILLIRILIIA